MRAFGNVVRLAVTDPDALNEALADPEPETHLSGAANVVTERWWG